MPEVLIELTEPDLRAVEKFAREQHRSRKGQMELIIEQWIHEELVKDKTIKEVEKVFAGLGKTSKP